MQKSSISLIDFLLRVLGVSTGLIVFANLVASGFKLHLGLVLFFLGILSMGIGSMLNLPARRYQRSHGYRHVNLFKLPAPEEYIAGNLFVARNPAPFYCFQNVLLLAGFAVLFIGLILLF